MNGTKYTGKTKCTPMSLNSLPIETQAATLLTVPQKHLVLSLQ